MLNGIWKLSCIEKNIHNVEMNIPGDIHSALLNAGIIPDPYFGLNEKEVEWVHFSKWKIDKNIVIGDDYLHYSAIILKLQNVDTFTEIVVNGSLVLKTNNMFRIYSINIKEFLVLGENNISITFFPPSNEAEKIAESLSNEIPWSVGNNQLPHMNLIRKAQFHSGWDWGPYLVPYGIYSEIQLNFIDEIEFIGVQVFQNIDFQAKVAHITTELSVHCYKYPKSAIIIEFNGESTELTLKYQGPGCYKLSTVFHVDQPKLWFTHDLGNPFLYDLIIKLGFISYTKKIGIREIYLDTTKDTTGSSFTFYINQQPIFCKGANIIPVDCLPSRESSVRYQELLIDALQSNMNMIRIWGGGYFFNDYVYDYCDELGILIWHDLMFACAQYSTSESFFDQIHLELTEQIMRLQYHSSIAIWCGDNEVWTTINWSDGTKNNKSFYREEYAKLNRFLIDQMNLLDSSRKFWFASPSNGSGDYLGQFVDIDNGDTHYWEVWHGSLDFSGYLSIIPRFCSEFGFQSYPSLPTTFLFAPKTITNIHHPIFEAHQKSKCGNQKIQDMFSRYFMVPNSFETTLYLSQVQQAIAIKTAVEFWRRNKAICSGALFWQLNDCWPVSSWSSIEYQGRWKQLMYQAKRFFDPILFSFTRNGEYVELYLTNDHNYSLDLGFTIQLISFTGEYLDTTISTVNIESFSSKKIIQLPLSHYQQYQNDAFLYLSSILHNKTYESLYFFVEFRECNIMNPNITSSISNDGKFITINTDFPAFFVHFESEDCKKFSDSSLTLLPNKSQHIYCENQINPQNLKIYFLQN